MGNSYRTISDNIGQYRTISDNIGQYQLQNDIPLILDSTNNGFCLHYSTEDEKQADDFIENIVFQLLYEQPLGQLDIYLFDKTLRKRFPYLKNLSKFQIFTYDFDRETAFAAIEQTIRKRHQELFNLSTPDIHTYNQQSKHKEPYIILLINADDYPEQQATLRWWREFYQASASAGVYIIAYSNIDNTDKQADARIWLKENLTAIHLKNGQFSFPKLENFAQFSEYYAFEALQLNKEEITNYLAQQTSTQESGQDYLSIKIGTSLDGRDEFYFNLGYRKNNHHSLLTGRSGSGKTALLNNLILRIGEQYTSNQFRLYLMDYKNGVEFQAFANHPNVEQIYLDNEDIEAGQTLIHKFATLCLERAELLKKEGLKDIDSYNQRFPERPIPRILLIIDEFQAMLTDRERAKSINADLKTIVKQGRSFGVHLLLATQSMLNVDLHDDVKAEIGLRMTYQMIDRQAARAILAIDNIDLVATLGQFQLLYNDNAGQISGNHVLRADPPQDISSTIARIRSQRDATLCLQPQIFTSSQNENRNNPADMNTASKAPSPSVEESMAKARAGLTAEQEEKASLQLSKQQSSAHKE